jgi:hypothetical protein
MSYKVPLTNLQNVAAGNTATLKLPVGKGAPTYDQIKLILAGGALPAHIESIRGKANGRIFMDESNGTDLKKRHVYRGIPSTDGFAVIDFTEPKARNGAAEQLVASVPGALLQDLSLEIKLAAGFVGTIKAAANYRPPTTNPFIRKLLNTSQAFSAAGTDGAPNIMYLPTQGAGGKMKRIWIHEDGAGAITSVQLRIARNVVYEASRTELEDDQKRNGLTPQASICVLDFIEDGNLAGMLDTSNAPEVELRMATSAAGSYRVYYELIDPITRL